MEIVLQLKTDEPTRLAFLEELHRQAKDYNGVFKQRDSFISKVNAAIAPLSKYKAEGA